MDDGKRHGGPAGDAFDAAHWTRAARRGSQAAFSALYRRFAPLVHAILLGRVRAAVADELTQECFVLAFARLSQLRDDDKFGPWIAAMARRIEPSRRDRPWEALSESEDPRASPEANAEAAQLLRAIAGLPEAYRETVMLRLVEGLGGAEIAELCGLTPGSVRVNLHRGMRQLRLALGIDASAETEELPG